jgi:hypothetical protein
MVISLACLARTGWMRSMWVGGEEEEEEAVVRALFRRISAYEGREGGF